MRIGQSTNLGPDEMGNVSHTEWYLEPLNILRPATGFDCLLVFKLWASLDQTCEHSWHLTFAVMPCLHYVSQSRRSLAQPNTDRERYCKTAGKHFEQ
jgi:hypothetical protein